MVLQFDFDGIDMNMKKNVEKFVQKEKFLILDDQLISLGSQHFWNEWRSKDLPDLSPLEDGIAGEDPKGRGISMEDVNFHFIFNALNNIKCSVMLHEENASGLIDDFSKYLRYVFCYSGRDILVPAGKVLDYLQESRYEKLQFEYCVGTTNFSMPPFFMEEIVSVVIKEFVMEKTCDGYLIVETEEEADQNILKVQTLSGICSRGKWERLMGSNGKLSEILKKGESHGYAVSAKMREKGGVCIRIATPCQKGMV